MSTVLDKLNNTDFNSFADDRSRRLGIDPFSRGGTVDQSKWQSFTNNLKNQIKVSNGLTDTESNIILDTLFRKYAPSAAASEAMIRGRSGGTRFGDWNTVAKNFGGYEGLANYIASGGKLQLKTFPTETLPSGGRNTGGTYFTPFQQTEIPQSALDTGGFTNGAQANDAKLIELKKLQGSGNYLNVPAPKPPVAPVGSITQYGPPTPTQTNTPQTNTNFSIKPKTSQLGDFTSNIQSGNSTTGASSASFTNLNKPTVPSFATPAPMVNTQQLGPVAPSGQTNTTFSIQPKYVSPNGFTSNLPSPTPETKSTSAGFKYTAGKLGIISPGEGQPLPPGVITDPKEGIRTFAKVGNDVYETTNSGLRYISYDEFNNQLKQTGLDLTTLPEIDPNTLDVAKRGMVNRIAKEQHGLGVTQGTNIEPTTNINGGDFNGTKIPINIDNLTKKDFNKHIDEQVKLAKEPDGNPNALTPSQKTNDYNQVYKTWNKDTNS